MLQQSPLWLARYVTVSHGVVIDQTHVSGLAAEAPVRHDNNTFK